MNRTGVFLPVEKLEEVRKLLSPKITILKTGLQITKSEDKEGAWKIIDAFANQRGLPTLTGGSHYGLSADGEIVTV